MRIEEKVADTAMLDRMTPQISAEEKEEWIAIVRDKTLDKIDMYYRPLCITGEMTIPERQHQAVGAIMGIINKAMAQCDEVTWSRPIESKHLAGLAATIKEADPDTMQEFLIDLFADLV